MSFICPHCKQPCTITTADLSRSATFLERRYKGEEIYALNVSLITCPNTKCGKITATGTLSKGVHLSSRSDEFIDLQSGTLVAYKQIYPDIEPDIIEIPDYIPTAIKNDYIEAVRIKSLSPKASATLARRCLQGIIRDFWGVKKGRLVDEIKEIEKRVDPITWQAIDAVRSIGNIGAHMEKDINLIIDVEPDEAQLLIGLIEILIKDWYITKHERQQHLKKIIGVAGKKKEKKTKKSSVKK